MLPISMMVMLGLACCRASSSQLARWLKVSRLHSHRAGQRGQNKSGEGAARRGHQAHRLKHQTAAAIPCRLLCALRRSCLLPAAGLTAALLCMRSPQLHAHTVADGHQPDCWEVCLCRCTAPDATRSTTAGTLAGRPLLYTVWLVVDRLLRAAASTAHRVMSYTSSAPAAPL